MKALDPKACPQRRRHGIYSQAGKPCPSCHRTPNNRRLGAPLKLLQEPARTTFLRIIRLGLTDKEACDAAGIHQSVWSRYKRWAQDGIDLNENKKPCPHEITKLYDEYLSLRRARFELAATTIMMAAKPVDKNTPGDVGAARFILRSHPEWRAGIVVEGKVELSVAEEARARLRKRFPYVGEGGGADHTNE